MFHKLISTSLVIAVVLTSAPALAKAKRASKAKPSVSHAEIQKQIEDYQEQLQLIDEKELADDDFDRAFFERIRSTYDREIRRLEQLKINS